MARRTKDSLTAERLREVLAYDPLTGVFRWKIRPCTWVPAGSIAGGLNAAGYREIRVDKVLYYAHRLAVLYMTGHWPARGVDHRQREPDDNRWEKLREASQTENNANAGLRRDNRTGLKGAALHKQSGKYRARIRRDGIELHLGLFDTAEEAHAAYVAKAKELFGEFARAA